MKFGKLEDISQVNFTLPPTHPKTWQVLGNAMRDRQNKDFNVYFGATGWSNKEWVGKWYPGSAKPKDYLYHYTRQFNTIELNTTHYRIPDNRTVDRWRETAPDGFLFCPKVPQLISHMRRMSGSTRKAALP